jgi:F0F1-type ATP synthase membrane subunit b/b'
MFLKVDGTFWFQLVNFAIFFALLNVVFLRPVGEAIKKRRAYIESVDSDYMKYSSSVRDSRAEADQTRAAARREADETIAKARIAAENEATAIVGERTTEAQAIADLARATVATEVQAARAREGELAQALAKTLLERATGTAAK